MWSVLLLVGLTKAVSFVAGIASVVDEKSGEFLDVIARNISSLAGKCGFFQLERRSSKEDGVSPRTLIYHFE